LLGIRQHPQLQIMAPRPPDVGGVADSVGGLAGRWEDFGFVNLEAAAYIFDMWSWGGRVI